MTCVPRQGRQLRSLETAVVGWRSILDDERMIAVTKSVAASCQRSGQLIPFVDSLGYMFESETAGSSLGGSNSPSISVVENAVAETVAWL